MGDYSRRRAQLWTYKRHNEFEANLHESNARWFAERVCAINRRMPYLLEDWKDWPKNIILPKVANFIQEEQKKRIDSREGFPLHKYIHHGLSSQAILFNLIGPLVVEGDLGFFRQALETKGVVWPTGEVTPKFEAGDRNIFNEDSGQPTSIDFVIKNSNNARSLFIESKLVERELGGCTGFSKRRL